MGVIAKLFGLDNSPPGPGNDFWYQPAGWGAMSQAGVRVSAETAITIPAVLACTRVIAETIATLPFQILEVSLSDPRVKKPARHHPLWDLLHDQPNDEQSSVEFFEMMIGHAVLRKAGYAQIVSGRRGFADQLIPLHPDRVTPERLQDGRLRYRYQHPEGGTEYFTADEIFRIPSPLGMSVLAYGRETFGAAIAARDLGSRMHSQGTTKRGAIMRPKEAPKWSDDARKRFVSDWQANNAGSANAGRTVVLEEGMTWQEIGISLVDLQWIEQQKLSKRDVATLFRMQPHKIGDLENATFTNIEQQAIEHVVDTIRPWAVRTEKAVTKDLILDKQRFLPKVVLEGLLRGDSTARSQFYQRLVLAGIMTRNEARELEDRNPIDGLDEPLEPMNMRGGIDNQQGGNALAMPVASGSSLAGRRAKLLAESAAQYVVGRERAAIERAATRLAADGDAWRAWVREFYGAHAKVVAKTLVISDAEAVAYCLRHAGALLDDGVAAAGNWDAELPRIAALALGEAA